MFHETEVPTCTLKSVSFGLYGSDQIKKLSVKEITNPQTFDALLHPTHGGLYDPALGPQDREDVCTTCGQGSLLCPGHMGHITLPLPVYNPLLFSTMVQLLRRVCFECHHMMMSAERAYTLQCQMEALDLGQVSLVHDLEQLYFQRSEEAWEYDDFKDKCSQCLKNAIQGDNSISSKKSNVKQVVECRNLLIRDLVRGAIGEKRICPRCRFTNKILRTQHHAKLFFSSRMSKAQAQKMVEKKQKEAEARRLQQKFSRDGDDAEEVVMEGGEENVKTEEHEMEVKKLMEGQLYFTPTDTQKLLRNLWDNEKQLLLHLFPCLSSDHLQHPTDIFFLQIVPVPPSKFRPVSVMRDKRFENPQTANLARVLADCWSIREILSKIKALESTAPEQSSDPSFSALPGSTPLEKLQLAWLNLQAHINCLMDKDLDKLSSDALPGIKQLLEKKEGLFRMHMMGKRVNYAARSVISPDPYIATNEIGIPDVFARKFTYPQPVTPWNFTELKQAVINGPSVHPGATIVEAEDGKRTLLSFTNRTQREAIAKQLLTPATSTGPNAPNKKVYRHLRNGDVLLLNRQPTLHRPSIQAHRARILPGQKTLRLHYSNCKAYNADFDGDEMNAHLLQNELARSEAYGLAATDFQYLTPKDGTPLAGLIQDHMVSGVSLTMRGRHFTRADYQQLVYSGLTDVSGPVTLLPPCIIKPAVLWSGKQVLSTILLNVIPKNKPAVNLTGNSKISSKSWIKSKQKPWLAGGTELTGDYMSETEVVIRHGELLVGVLDKAHYGPTSYGLVHACFELYGGEVAGCFLSCLGKVFTTFLQYLGFTLGVEDILVQTRADKKRRKVISNSTKCGAQVAAKALAVSDPDSLNEILSRMEQARFAKDDGDMKDLDLQMKSQTDKFQNDISKACMDGLHKKFPSNNLQLMVQSGAKGSMVNCMQISSLLGQIELEGRRPPVSLSGRSLPSFQPYDMTPRSRGFVVGRFLTGIRPQEYFFHCMAGREGLVDTAVKTSRSGYLQRCIIKHLEGLTVNYDLTVRDSDGSLIQFHYGEDSLDICRTPYLLEKQFPFLLNNSEAALPQTERTNIKARLDTKSAAKLWSQVEKWKRKKKKETGSGVRSSPFLRFCKKKWSGFIEEHPQISVNQASGRQPVSDALCLAWRDMNSDKRAKYDKHTSRQPDPVFTRLPPGRHLGVISDKFKEVLDSYAGRNPHKLISDTSQPGSNITEDDFKFLMNTRYLKALTPPGEAVGLLAAQSIGEPSTQMTLNTFHFAGRGEMNVTLGIPRLREILMVASANIRTPAMDIPVLEAGHAKKRISRLQKTLNKVHLAQVLEDVDVTESLSVKPGSQNYRLYTIHFSFLPPELYRDENNLVPEKILAFMEKHFIRHLCNAVKKRVAEMERSSLLSMARVRVRDEVELQEVSGASAAATRMEEDEVVDDDLHDGDATADKTRQRQMEEQDYLGEEAEKEEAGLGQEGVESDNEEEPEAVEVATPDDSSVSDDEGGDEMEEDVVAQFTPGHKKKKKSHNDQTEAMIAKRINAVLSYASQISDYTYDTDNQLWCKVTLRYAIWEKRVDMASIVESEAKKVIVSHCPGISRSFLSENKETSQMHLKTEGVNIHDMYRYQDILDINQLYTNDVHAMAQTYGIEAACRVITKEIKDVFGAYGITVNSRHLSLVADYMTSEGRYKAFNRIAIESNASPFQKMTFETTMHFLRAATVQGSSDDLESPSARLVVGRLVKGGTGCFDVLTHPI